MLSLHLLDRNVIEASSNVTLRFFNSPAETRSPVLYMCVSRLMCSTIAVVAFSQLQSLFSGVTVNLLFHLLQGYLTFFS